MSSCKPVLCLLRRQIHFVSSTASRNGEKEQKKIKVRICQGAGARGGKGGCPELWEARVNKAEAASCREIWEESMYVNRQRNSRMNWLLTESASHAALPSCQKAFICPFLWESWEAIIKGTDPRQSVLIWAACAPVPAPAWPPSGPHPPFTRANWVARLKPEGTNWCCGGFLQSAKDQSH